MSDAPEFNWREHLKVHPAAELCPLLSKDRLKELAEGIKAVGLRVSIVLWAPADGRENPALLDGRNRLDALASLGLLYETEDHHIGIRKWNGTKWSARAGDRIRFEHIYGGDPYEIVVALNVHRRHLTDEQKREVIAKLLKLQPEKSNRAIAEIAKADHKTVAAVRVEGESTGELPQSEKRIGKDGKARPARKKPAASAAERAERRAAERAAAGAALYAGRIPSGATLLVTGMPPPADDPAASAEARKAEHAAADVPQPIQHTPLSVRSWMRTFRHGMELALATLPPADSWSAKQADEAGDLAMRLMDDLEVRLTAIREAKNAGADAAATAVVDAEAVAS